MNLEDAKTKFVEMIEDLSTEEEKQFISWIQIMVIPEIINKDKKNGSDGDLTEATIMLEKIAGDIRPRVPIEAVLESESIHHPSLGEDAELNKSNSLHLDAFLYDKDGEDLLFDEGQLARSFCVDCGSRNIEDITFITHSCSKKRLENIFCDLLPSLESKTIIDIGSRIGAVLYGAYFYSKAAKIVGIELNSELCQLQNEIISLHNMGDRVCVIEGDMVNHGEIIKKGDVVLLNNVFEWFMSPDDQIKMWQFLHSILTPGSYMVTIPPLKDSLEHLETGIKINNWVEVVKEYIPDEDDECQDNQEVETSKITLYKVIST